MPRLSLTAVVFALALVFALSASPARASQLIDRDATGVKLAVNSKGEALVTYRANGKLRRVLVWGAINALPPSATVPQVKFQLDYSGGWGRYHTLYWAHFKNSCRPYDGPALAYEVTACKAPDGSYWALQAWHIPWPDLGFAPWLPSLSETWLQVSHWRGPVAQLQVYSDWVYGNRFHQLFGNLTYAGQPVHGFKSTRYGASLDGYGRLIFLDTLDAPAYGPGWRRENSFLAHNPSGAWCYGFYNFNPQTGGYQHPAGYAGISRGPGVGSSYRLSVIGPGVTPDISLTVPDLGDYDAKDASKAALELKANGILDTMMANDHQCREH